MESKFIPTLQVGNGYTYLKLKGILDEDNLLANLLSQIQGRLVLIDMAEIERINSCGVRDWVNWLNQIQALGIAVILLRCSPAVVSQANMVTNFAADAFIHSFYAPYVHPDTGDEQCVLLFTEDIRQNLPIRAPKIFNEAGEELEFDEFEESYFAFVSDPRILNYQIPQDIQAVIQYFLPEAASRQPVIGNRTQSAPQPQMQSMGSPMTPSSPYGASVPTPYQSGVNSQIQQNAQLGYGAQQNRFPQQPTPYQNNFNSQSMPANPQMPGNPGSLPPRSPQPIQQNYGAPNANPYGAPKPQAMMPSPASPMMRHEQPPLPSNENSQSVQPRQIPASQHPSREIPPAAMQSPSANNMASVQARPVSPMSAAEARPAPQPVSPLAQQSMARQLANAARSGSLPPVPAVQNSTPEQPVSSFSQQNISPYPNPSYQQMYNVPNHKGRHFIIIGGAVVVVVLIVLLIIILMNK